jgi:hypothetical protein
VYFLQGVGSGNEFGFDTNPTGGTPGGMDYGWPDGTYNVTFSRSGTGFTFINFSGAGPSQFTSRNTGAACGDWDTLQVAIVVGDSSTNVEFLGVAVDGAAAGDLVDNDDGVAENHFWTFNGDYADGVTVTGQLVVSGWDAATWPRPRLEVTVGCGQ